MPEIIIVSDAVEGTFVDSVGEGVDLPVPRIAEKFPEVVETITQKHISDDLPVPQECEVVPQVPEETVELVELVSQVQQRTAEVPVDLVELVSQERVQQRTSEAQFTGNLPQERISERTQIVDEPVADCERERRGGQRWFSVNARNSGLSLRQRLRCWKRQSRLGRSVSHERVQQRSRRTN